MNLVNIGNQKRIIYLFQRDEQGNQIITKDASFFPYFFEPENKGPFVGYDGKKLRKVFCNEPGEVAKIRSTSSYEADILYPKRYLIDRVRELDKCVFRYVFVDIEVLSKEFPDFRNPKAPISCVSVYDSFTKDIKTWYIDDMVGKSLSEKENVLLRAFIKHMQDIKPDLLLGWNIYFDYNYLDARTDMFAQQLSPVNRVRVGDYDDKIFYPIGVSIVDYLTLFKKVNMREQSYQLDAIAQKYLGEDTWGETKFGELTPRIKEKNIHDVERLIALEDKFKILPYFDEVRRLSKCQWEDFCVRLRGQSVSGNSRIIEMLLFEEAKKQKVILPNKSKQDEDVEFEGAFRDVFDIGVHYGAAKLDISSAYPSAIVNFCLDPTNIVEPNSPNAININGTWFQQNAQALVPTMIKRILTLKDNIKKEVKANPNDIVLKIKYDAIKAIVNSGFGVIGLPYFRLYNLKVAGAITFLIRDLLHYVKDQLEKKGYKVIYCDTDSIVTNSQDNIAQLCNELVASWAQDHYKKSTVDIRFEYEGYFERLLLLKKCRYLGYLNNGKSVKEEIKGLEVKRGDSSKFMQAFQRELIDRILNKDAKAKVLAWIVEQAERMKTLPLEDVAFPCKVGKEEDDYKNTPIFMRALEYAQELKALDKVRGELFYYIYIHPTDFDEEITEKYYIRQTTQRTLKSGQIKEGSKKITVTKTAYENMSATDRKNVLIDKVPVKKPKNVIAFDRMNKGHVKNIDWPMMIERNIVNKCEALFEALGWDQEVEELRGALLKKDLMNA